MVWEAPARGARPAALAFSLITNYGIPSASATGNVHALLQMLRDKGLLAG